MSMNERATQRGDWAGIPGAALQYYIDQAFVGTTSAQPTVVHVGIAVDVLELEPDHDPERVMLLRGLGFTPPQEQGRIEGDQL